LALATTSSLDGHVADKRPIKHPKQPPKLIAIIKDLLFGPRTTRARHFCASNQLQIHGAKQQWAWEDKRLATDIPNAADLAPTLKSNQTPICPEGHGKHFLNAVSTHPQ